MDGEDDIMAKMTLEMQNDAGGTIDVQPMDRDKANASHHSRPISKPVSPSKLQA